MERRTMPGDNFTLRIGNIVPPLLVCCQQKLDFTLELMTKLRRVEIIEGLRQSLISNQNLYRLHKVFTVTVKTAQQAGSLE